MFVLDGSFLSEKCQYVWLDQEDLAVYAHLLD